MVLFTLNPDFKIMPLDGVHSLGFQIYTSQFLKKLKIGFTSPG